MNVRKQLAIAIVLLTILMALVLVRFTHKPSSAFSIGKEPRLKWQFGTEGRIFSTPAIGEDGTVYVTSYKLLYALKPDGGLRWKYFPGHPVEASPLIAPDGTIYVGDDWCLLHALRPDGSKVWVAELGQTLPGGWDGGHGGSCSIKNTPVLSFGALLVGNSHGSLYRVETGTGNTTIRLSQLGGRGTPAVLANGQLVGSLASFDADGTIAWTVDPPRWQGFGPPAVANDGTIIVTGTDGKLRAFTPGGSAKWEFDIESPSATVIAADGTVYVSNNHGLTALSAEGSLLWQTPISFAGPPAIAADGTIYLSSQQPGGEEAIFKLYAVSSKGAVKWTWPIDGEVRSSPAIGPDGTVYVATQGKISELAGTVYAIQEQNGGLMKGGWPKSYATVANDSRAQSFH